MIEPVKRFCIQIWIRIPSLSRHALVLSIYNLHVLLLSSETVQNVNVILTVSLVILTGYLQKQFQLVTF